ncbi:bidirectional hydrogenase complex protein HoxE [Scytonema sp. UIC 10036]|uniref:bidirectional hydrogenase complex protein HoxE n=1 Tax=Scytonema sp. UIC 10036 TaxID=2304196 RepID=UPI0012DA7E7B|nr:bidirectional hydrogenase complex protein HoxE [Scytonema sp. UIC 10036]MUG98564.1 bidirectional hydrogenase complex protein HoxE [Scytonema sp. UIC 10036]
MNPLIGHRKNQYTKSPLQEYPSGDKRFKILDATIKRYQYQQDALIEVLHEAQELFGYLKNDLLLYIAHSLKLPPSRVYGVATFYHLFSLAPKGVHSCVVCTGTACYVKGAADLLTAAEKYAKIHTGETTLDNQLSLLTARCLGACGIAPAVVFDEMVCGHQTPELVTEQIKGWLEHGSDGTTRNS